MEYKYTMPVCEATTEQSPFHICSILIPSAKCNSVGRSWPTFWLMQHKVLKLMMMVIVIIKEQNNNDNNSDNGNNTINDKQKDEIIS